MSIVRRFFFLFFFSYSLILFVYCLSIFSLIDCLIINSLLNCNIHKGYVVRVVVLRDVQCVDVFILFLIITLFLLFFCVTHLLLNNLCKHLKVYISYPFYLELRQSLMNIKHNESMNITRNGIYIYIYRKKRNVC
jgi:hypothetical protein